MIRNNKLATTPLLTDRNEKLEVIDADFENRIFYTSRINIPFAETNKQIE